MSTHYGLLTASEREEAERLCARCGVVMDAAWLDAGLAIRHDDERWVEHISSVFPDGMLATEPEFTLMSRYAYQRFIEHKVQVVRAYEAQTQGPGRPRIVNPERERALAAGSSTEPDIDIIERALVALDLVRWWRKHQLRGTAPDALPPAGEVAEPEVEVVLHACGLDPAEAAWPLRALARGEVRIAGLRDLLDDPELWPPGPPSDAERALLQSVASAAEKLANYITFGLLGQGEFAQAEMQAQRAVPRPEED